MFRVTFELQAEVTRNFILGVVVTRPARQEDPELCGWDALTEAGRCVYICYELCEAFPLSEGTTEYLRLQKTMQRILSVQVHLLPFTQFERSFDFLFFSPKKKTAILLHLTQQKQHILKSACLTVVRN